MRGLRDNKEYDVFGIFREDMGTLRKTTDLKLVERLLSNAS